MRDLSEKKLGQFSKAMEAAQAAFYAEIDALAEKARAQILPYFKEHGLDFVAGAGWGWRITRPAGSSRRHAEKFVQDEDLPSAHSRAAQPRSRVQRPARPPHSADQARGVVAVRRFNSDDSEAFPVPGRAQCPWTHPAITRLTSSVLPTSAPVARGPS